MTEADFLAVSAVEGLELSKEAKARFKSFKDRNLTPEQKRAEVIEVYRVKV